MTNSDYVFPSSITPWKKARVSDIKCPSVTKQIYYPKLKEIEVRKLSYHDKVSNLAKGYMCVSNTYKVTCHTNFFGVHSYKRDIDPSLVSESACKILIRDMRDNPVKIVPAYFPSPNCGWMITRTSSMHHFELIKHDVIYDPYKEEFLDPLFIQGKCASELCYTIYTNMIWYGDSGLLNHCVLDMATQNAELFKDPKSKIFLIRLDNGEVKNITGSCSIKFCGEKGVLSQEGEFIGMNLWGSDERYPKCSDQEIVSVRKRVNSELILDETLIREVQDEICNLAIMDLNVKNSISRELMSYLQPRYPGINNIYRLNGDFIEWASASYVSVFNITITEGDLTVYSDNAKIEYRDWLPGVGCEGEGFNGIYKDNKCKIIIPHLYSLREEINIKNKIRHEIIWIKHPIEAHWNKSVEYKTKIEDGDYDNSLWMSLPNLTKTLTIITLLSMGGLGIIIWICISRRNRRVKLQSHDLPDFRVFRSEGGW